MNKKKINTSSLTDREKLQLLYEQFLILNHKSVSMNFEYTSKAVDYVKNSLSTFMFKLFDYTGLPQVVSVEEYEKLEARELFRGIDDMDYHAELLCSEEYYQSYWHNGIGIFSTTERDWAEQFFTKNSAEHVLKFKYTGKTLDRINDKSTNFAYFMALKSGNYKDIKDENIINKCKVFREFIEDKKSDVPNIKGINYDYAERRGKQDFAELMTVDDTFMPVYLGYDCFDFDINHYHRPEIVIQNRGKMVVSLSEYNRICKASKKFKHCVKTEADLIPEPLATTIL